MSSANSWLWNLYALCYDAVNESPPYRQLLSLVISKLNLKPGQKILDAGCGTGNLEVLISDRGLKNLEIEAIDNNRGMLERARKKTIGIKTNFRQADLNQPLPYPDDSFDRVVAIHVLYALQNPEAALREFFRVLQPGGLLVLANPHEKSRPSELMKANLADLNLFGKIRLLLTKLPLIIVNLLICRLAQSGTYHFLSKTQLNDLLKETGFTNIFFEPAYADQDLLVCAHRS
jgi:ubiquinone/menaquinone biosynthesis C-methylase UbiE